MSGSKLKILILLFLPFCGCGHLKSQLRYHSLEKTSSSFQIKEWNIPESDAKKGNYIEEKVDSEGRVKYLKFKNGDKFIIDVPGQPSMVSFEYKKDTIIEIYFIGNELACITESDLPCKVVYYVDKNELFKCLYQFDNKLKEECNNEFVNFYSLSSAKYNGLFPHSDSFKVDHYYFGEAEKAAILKSME